MGEPEDDLKRITERMHVSDEALVRALDERAQAARAFAELRDRDPDGIYRPPSESDVLGRARDLAAHFPVDSLAPVFREVLSACARILGPVTVAYRGPEGSFAHVAARRIFGAAAELRPVDSVVGVLDEVQRDRVSFGVVPMETSTDGALTATLHGLVEAKVQVCQELTLRATYSLFSSTGNARDVEKIYGAPGDIAACELHLRAQFPRATTLDVPSGEIAAQFAQDDHGAAAVGTDVVAEQRNLRLVRSQIDDHVGVETRFAVVSEAHPPRTGTDRTIVALAVHDEPGTLYNALHPFADRGINLTRLESRPAQSAAWRYLFFIELDGHVTDRLVVTALEEVRASSPFVKVLGSYPRPD